METIEVRGLVFKVAKARDFEVIIREDNGFINYTKLCQQINGGKKPFYNIKKNDDFKRLCIQMENSAQGFPLAENLTSLYKSISDKIEYELNGANNNNDNARISGTYMPRYLLDYVIMTCDISYYKLIHELMDTIDKVSQERQIKFIEELQSNINYQKAKLDKRKIKISDLKSTVERIERQNQELLDRNDQLEDMLANMQQNAEVIERKHTAKLHSIFNATTAIHNKFATMQVKDLKQHRTNDVLILYTSAEKPKDDNLREHTPEGYIWISTFNGQRLNFRAPQVPRDRHVLLEIESNRLDSFKTLLDKPNISAFIQNRTQYRDVLVETARLNEFLEVITNELNQDDNFSEVERLEGTVLNNPVNNEEIELKRRLLQQYQPCLINAYRYKRRLYCEVNDELVLIENFDHAENYPWKYKYGPCGRLTANVDLKILKTSKFTDEIETRINYE